MRADPLGMDARWAHMIDILAPLGLVFLALFVVAIVLTARKQRRERAELFERLADLRGWEYLEVDDGTAQELSDGFRDFARFHSPSLGDRPPENVVLGRIPEGRVCVFSHGTRQHQGDARQWTICLVEAAERLAPAARIRPRDALRADQLGRDPSVVLGDDSFDEAYEVESADAEGITRALGPSTRHLFVESSRRLAFSVEIQIRDRRLAAYPARRNDAPESLEELDRLVAFGRDLASSMRS